MSKAPSLDNQIVVLIVLTSSDCGPETWSGTIITSLMSVMHEGIPASHLHVAMLTAIATSVFCGGLQFVFEQVLVLERDGLDGI